jgi:hypothetical protein
MTAHAHQFPAYPVEDAMKIEPPKRLAIELPDDERGRGEFDLRELDRINARLLANAYRPGGGKTAAELRDADLTRRDDLERKPQLKADQRWLREATDETVALACGRGEEVSTDKSGVKRILDRDPIVSLTWLTEDQFRAGKTLREAYERRGEDAGAMEITGMPNAAHDHERFVANRFSRAKATNLIGRTERRIAVECRHEPAALHALRWVCGEGKTLSSLGAGRAYDRNCKALAMALDVADAEIKRR